RSELRFGGPAQINQHRSYQVAQRIVLAHDVGGFETPHGEEGLERLDQSAVSGGRQVATNRLIADRKRGLGPAGLFGRLEKQNRSKGFRVASIVRRALEARQARGVASARDYRDRAVGRAEIEPDCLYR